MILRRKYAPVGSNPGTLVIDKITSPPNVQVFNYDQNSFVETLCSYEIEGDNYKNKLQSIVDISVSNKELDWIDVRGIGHEDTLRLVANAFSLHDLSVSDIVNVPQRPKIEEQESYLLIITSIPSIDEDYILTTEQVSIILGSNFVLTFQENEADVFEPIRTRIRQAKGNLRKNGSDYLAYALIDAIIDNYFPVLEKLGIHLEEIEEELVFRPDKNTLKEIYRTKRTLLQLRRSIWPHREIFSAILRDEFKVFKKSTKNYLRDLYDHTVEIIDVVETYRELSGGFMDIYLSSISHRLNDVMKVLTVISTIFIPLTFIVGVYGMNFENMPELKFEYGYPILIIVMLFMGLAMLFFFWKKGWLISEKFIED